MDTPATTASATAARGYEFSVNENATLRDTAKWVGLYAWIAMIFGGLSALAGIITIPAGIVNLVIGVLFILIGMWLRAAAQSFNEVVDTTGNDVAHLMTALEKLGAAFKAMVIMTAVAFVLVILAIVIGGALAVALMSG